MTSPLARQKLRVRGLTRFPQPPGLPYSTRFATNTEAVAGTSSATIISPATARKAIPDSIASPKSFGAVGDGTTNDLAAMTAASAAYPGAALFLDAGSTFEVGAAEPALRVRGPGKIKRGSTVIGGFDFAFDPIRSNIAFTPDEPIATLGFPSTPGHLNTVISAGSKALLGTAVRSTLVGSRIVQETDADIDRVDAFGDSPFRRMKYGDRCSAFASIALEQAGAQEFTGHNFWFDGGGSGVFIAPGSVGWNYQGLETRNPGIGAKILAAAVPAATRTDVTKLGAFMRDAMNFTIKGEDSLMMGYRAGAYNFIAFRNNGVGTEIFRDGVFLKEASGIGHRNGMSWQEGERMTLLGTYNFFNTVRGSKVIGLGFFNAPAATDANNSILIGFDQLPGITTLANVFALGSNPLPLIAGQLDTGRFGVNILPADMTGIFTVRDTAGNAGLLLDASRRLVVNHSASVQSVALSPQMQVHGTAASSSSSSVTRWSTGAGGPSMILGKSRGTTQGTFAPVAANDVLGQLYFAGDDGAALQSAGLIRVLATGAIGANAVPGRMQLQVSPAGSVTPQSVIDFTATTIGFLGATPVSRPALPAAATDLATVIALANALRTQQINVGLAT
jgi:hypothetical protein